MPPLRLTKRADPSRLSARTRREEVLRPEIWRVLEDNWRVYGVRKIWWQLVREGIDVACCTVARLMKDMGVQGIIRGERDRTTIPDKKAPSFHQSAVDRDMLIRQGLFAHIGERDSSRES